MTDRQAAVVQINRILVTLDSSTRARAALKVAVQLATSMHAEIQGLFVEDEDLIRLAALPFACEVDFTSAAPRRLIAANMERELLQSRTKPSGRLQTHFGN